MGTPPREVEDRVPLRKLGFLTIGLFDEADPRRGHESTLEVKPSKTGSTVVWSSRFQVKDGTPEADARKAIAGIYRLGLDNLATAIE